MVKGFDNPFGLRAMLTGANTQLSTACQRIESLSRKNGLILKKMHYELSPLIVWIALWIGLVLERFTKALFTQCFNPFKDKCHYVTPYHTISTYNKLTKTEAF